MKKILISLVFLFCAVLSFAQYPNSQSVSNTLTIYHAKGALTGDSAFMLPVNDTLNNLATPYYGAVTVLPSDRLKDTIPIWMSNGHHWIRVQGSTGAFNINDTIYTRLPIYVDTISNPGKRVIAFLQADGLISGGVVTIDSCMTIDITAPTFIKNYKQYIGVATFGVVVTPADPSLPRIDRVVIDTNLLITVIAGTPSVTPIAPPYNSFSQISLAEILVGAGVTCLGTQEIIFDGVGDFAGQWTPSTAGTGSTNFVNTAAPFHLLQASYTVTYSDGYQIIYTKPSGTDTVKPTSVLKGFTMLIGGLNRPNQISAQWYNGITPVSTPLLLNAYLNINDSNFYQMFVVPLNAWQWVGGTIFNKLVLTFGGNDNSGAKGLYFDWIQLQTGIANNVTSLQLTTNGTGGPATLINNVLNIPIYDGGGTIADTSFEWSVLDSLSTPPVFAPGQYVEGNKYLVGTAPTGLFVGHANNIATYDSVAAIYTFDTARIGDLLYNSTTDFVSKFQTGPVWVRVGRATLHQGGDTYGTRIVMGSRDNFATTFLVNNTLAGSIGTALSPPYNLSLGILSLPASSTGARNTALGSASLGLNTTGFNNTGVGYTSNYHNTTGSYNTAIGWGAVGWNSGDGNTAVGYAALNSTISVVRAATYNTSIGYEALQNNGDHKFNIGLGLQAGALTTTLPIAPVARDSTLYVSLFTKNMYFRLDTALGTAPSIIGYNPVTGFWNHYATPSGGNDSAYINVAVFDSSGFILIRKNGGQDTVSFVSDVPTWQETLISGSTLTQNNTVDLNGNTLQFNGATGAAYLFLDPVNFTSQFTSSDGTANGSFSSESNSGGAITFGINSSDGGSNQVSINGDALANTIDYFAPNHIFTGIIQYNTPPSGAATDSILTRDAVTGIVNMRSISGLLPPDTSFTANMLIYTNTATPTGVLANAAAFKAALIGSTPGDNNDSVEINAYRIVSGLGTGQVGLIEISISRLMVIPEGMFRGNTEITGFEDIGSLLSSGSEIRQGAFKNSTLQFFSAPLFGDINSSNMGDSAFYNCNSLFSVYLPAWDASATTNIFQSCDVLSHITVKSSEASVTSIAATNGFSPQVLANLPNVSASGDFISQTAALANVATYTPPLDGVYRIGGYINITAVTAGVVTLKVTYTDENSQAVTQIIPLTIAATGAVGTTATVLNSNNSALDIEIRAKAGSAITVLTTLTNVATYDVGATIEKLR